MGKIAKYIIALHGKASWWMFDPITVSVAIRSTMKFKTENRRRMTKLMTEKQTAVENPVVTYKSLQWQLHRGSANGLSKTTVKVDQRICVDAYGFEEWRGNQMEN